jgi:hypothetical protein
MKRKTQSNGKNTHNEKEMKAKSKMHGIQMKK